MKRDWVVWFGCVMLFFSGVVWGGLTLDTKFLKIDSLHDLFEIAGAIATCVAVYIAATWKRQLGSTRDYELARGFSVLSLKYKDAVIGIWEVADSCVAQIEQGEFISEPLRSAVSISFNARVELTEALRREVQGQMDECRAVWRNDVEKDFSKVFVFETNCSSCAKTYLSVIGHSVQGGSAVAARVSIRKYRQYFIELGLSSRLEVEAYVEKLFDPITLKLDSMMR